MILFFQEVKHIGGGQTFVDGYKDILHRKNVQFDFFENSIPLRMIKNIVRRSYQKAFVHLSVSRYAFLVLLLKIFNIPVVLTVYGVWFLEFQSQFETPHHRVRTWWLKCIQGIVFLCCQRLIVFSIYEKGLIERHFPYVKSKIVIIPGGVDPKHFYPVSTSKRARLRRILHLPQHSQIILVVSRVERRKGIDLAIEAFSKIANTYPMSVLYIVFPIAAFNNLFIIPELFHLIEKLEIGSRVFFMTGITHDQISRYFQASDTFLMSSRDLETFGLTTLEAAACGCIPVGFDSGATPEFLMHIDRSLIAHPVSPDTLAHVLHMVLALTPEKKRELVQKCQHAAMHYSWSNINTMLCDVLI